MPNKKEVVPAILLVGAPYSPLTGTVADKLNQLYQVRVAETRDTAVAYLRCMRFDLVAIDHTIADDIAAAITKEASPTTATYFPKRSGKTLTIVNEIGRQLKCQQTGREK